MHIAYWVFYGIVTLLFGAVLELKKNTIIGWILLVILAVIFPVLYMTKAFKRTLVRQAHRLACVLRPLLRHPSCNLAAGEGSTCIG
jgi:Flp pilus assembly protein TadB